MGLQKRYTILKATTIILGALTIPWSTFTGFCFGEGRYYVGLASLCAQTLVALVDGYIWVWVLENMRGRIQEETGKESGRDVIERSMEYPLLTSKGNLPVYEERLTSSGNQTGKPYL